MRVEEGGCEGWTYLGMEGLRGLGRAVGGGGNRGKVSSPEVAFKRCIVRSKNARSGIQIGPGVIGLYGWG